MRITHKAKYSQYLVFIHSSKSNSSMPRIAASSDPLLLLCMYLLMSHWENSVEIILPSHTGRTKLME